MSELDLQGLDWLPPEGIIEIEVDKDGGGLAMAGCTQQSVVRYFISGYEPLSNNRCKPLDDKLDGWLNKWFGSKPQKSDSSKARNPSDSKNLEINR